MIFKEVIALSAAEEEVNKYLDTKVIMPKRREGLQPAIEAVSEAVSYGFVAFNDDGSITQKLIEPIGALTELVYRQKVDAATMQKEIATVKVFNQSNINACYIKCYSGLLKAQTDKLEPADRNTADSISFFFQ